MKKYILFSLILLPFTLANAQSGLKTGVSFSELQFDSIKISSRGAHLAIFKKKEINKHLFLEYGLNYTVGKSEQLEEKLECSSNSNVISNNTSCIPEGSTLVVVGGVLLEEDRDYIVNYDTGRITITNNFFANNPDISIYYKLDQFYHYQIHHIQVPFLVGTNFDVGKFTLFIKAGPVANLGLIGRIKAETGSSSLFVPNEFPFDRGLKRIDIAVNGSTGLIFNDKWLLEFSYNRGLTNLNNDKEGSVVKNNILQISAGILF